MPTPAQPQAQPATPRPGTPVAEQPASIGALQSQAVDLTAQLVGLRVEQRVLRSQINSRGWDAATHPDSFLFLIKRMASSSGNPSYS